MKTPIIIGGTALAIGLAAIPGIKAVFDTAGPKFSDKPKVEVGRFTYSQTGCANQLTPEDNVNYADYYVNSFEMPLVNDSGVRVGSGAEDRTRLTEVIIENNALNDGRGGAVTKTAEDGSKYIEYEQMNLPGIPRYIINGQISIKCCEGSDKKQSVTITATIIDRMTGRVVGNSQVAGTGERMQNYQMIGPQPTIWERFFSGYVREIRYDDLLENMLGQSALETAAELLQIDPQVSNGREPKAASTENITIEKSSCGDPLPPFRHIVKAGSKDVNPKTPDSASVPKDDQPTTPAKDSTPPLAPPAATPKTLEAYCVNFNDAWFKKMEYVNGYCFPGTWGDVPVATPEASFGAAINIGLIGEGEFIAKMDEQFRTDWSGRNLPFGTSRTVENLEEEFKTVSLGSFATRFSLNSWEPVSDAKGVLLGHHQVVSIGYIVRQGRCYATTGMSGQGPLDSRLYYGILSGQMQKEAEAIAQKMKTIGLCGN